MPDTNSRSNRTVSRCVDLVLWLCWLRSCACTYLLQFEEYSCDAWASTTHPDYDCREVGLSALSGLPDSLAFYP
jgi:hypothetical protein